MPVNKSVERFRALTLDMQKTVRENAVNELNRQAGILKDAIASVAPIYEGPPEAGVTPGALKASVGVKPGNKETIVRVIAGGSTTTRKGVSGREFDYSRAAEFGTQQNGAQPFFFPTYRLMKKKIVASMKRRISLQIKKYSAAQGGGNV